MTALFEGLTHWHWLGLGFVLLAIEVLGSVGFLLWTGIAALEVGLILLLWPFGWQAQLLLFAARLGVAFGGDDHRRDDAHADDCDGGDGHRSHAWRFFRRDRSQQLHDCFDETRARRILGEDRLNPPGIDRRSTRVCSL